MYGDILHGIDYVWLILVVCLCILVGLWCTWGRF